MRDTGSADGEIGGTKSEATVVSGVTGEAADARSNGKEVSGPMDDQKAVIVEENENIVVAAALAETASEELTDSVGAAAPTSLGGGAAEITEVSDEELLEEVEKLRISVEREELLQERAALRARLASLKTAASPSESVPTPTTTTNTPSAVPVAESPSSVNQEIRAKLEQASASISSSLAPSTELEAKTGSLEGEKEALMAEKLELSEKLESLKSADAFIDQLLAKAEKRSGLVESDFNRTLDSADAATVALCSSPALYLRLDDRVGQESSSTNASLLRDLSRGLLAAVEKRDSEAAVAVKEALDVKLGNTMPSEVGGFVAAAAAAAGSESGATTSDKPLEDKEEQSFGLSSLFPKVEIEQVELNNETDLESFLENMMSAQGVLESLIPYWLPESLRQVFTSNVDRNELDMTAGSSSKNSPYISSISWSNSDIPKRIRSEVFKPSSFSVSEFRETPTALLLRGSIKTQRLPSGDNNRRLSEAELDEACYEDIKARLAAIPELDKEVCLLYQIYPMDFLQNINPTSQEDGGRMGDFDMETLFEVQPAPAFIVLPKKMQPKPNKLVERSFSALLLGTTSFATLASAVGAFALNPAFVQRVTDGDVTAVSDVTPVFVAILGFQLLHEIGHVASALFYGLELELPTLVPSLQIGSFGAITRFLTYPEDRKQFFDVSAAGPLVGFAASLAVFAIGLSSTEATINQQALTTAVAAASTTAATAPAASAAAAAATAKATAAAAAAGVSQAASLALASSLPGLPAETFQSSALFNAMASVFAPSLLSPTVPDTVFLDPLAVAGLTGLIVNALTLIPIGRTDGGRLLTAAVGRETAGIAGGLTLLAMAVSGFGGEGFTADLFLYYGVFVILFQREQDLPAKNEITELDNVRFGVFLAAMALVAFTLLPPLDGIDWAALTAGSMTQPGDGFDF